MRQLSQSLLLFASYLAISSALLLLPLSKAKADQPDPYAKFDKSNLVAWCIVPFDSQKRTPEQRAAMLQKLGISKFAYDYRAEHIPTFEREFAALKDKGIDLTAWWFPTTLNDEAKSTLEFFKKHDLHPQLWVTGGGDLNMDDKQAAAFLDSEVQRVRPIAQAAAEVGCKVALYNHGGWFGDPRNQIKIVKSLGLDNVGIVFNMHHAHDYVDQLPEILKELQPYLLALNLNGTKTDGDKLGYKILPIGEGDRDLEVIKSIRDCEYQGPIGILNHTDEDAELRLQDNLDGLSWVIEQLKGNESPKPNWRSFSSNPIVDQNLIRGLVETSKKKGDAASGLKIFASEKTACISCHRIGGTGGLVGPNLEEPVRQRTAEQLIVSILQPNAEVRPNYQAIQYLLEDGQTVKGYLLRSDDKTLTLRDPTSEREIVIQTSEIENEKKLPSLMPEGLVASLSYQNILDLMAFLNTLGTDQGMPFDVAGKLLAHAGQHHIAEMPLIAAPIHTERHPYSSEFVNRDRIYDFYTKQANYFRGRDPHDNLLQEYPGLDGSGFGHWGNQNEATWSDGSWNQADLGNVQSNCFRHDGRTVARAVCIRVGDNQGASACYNTDTLQFAAGWTGKFISYSPVRHGFMDGMVSDGAAAERPERHTWTKGAIYHGHFRFGPHVAFHVEDEGTHYLDSLWWQNGAFVRTVAPIDKHPLSECLKGSPAQWPQSIKTKIVSGDQHPYAIDSIELPLENPWKAKVFCADFDFFKDGSCLLSTMQGDVWHVNGFQEQGATSVTWRRFASGLYQPLGLKIVDDLPYVLCRDQILTLHDLNSDGEADEYRTFCRAFKTSSGGHDFICGLEQDAEGNFYTASGVEGILRITPDGSKAEVIATGFRNPDGLAVLSDGTVSVPCSEGEWTPTSMICGFVPAPDKAPFFGYGGPNRGGKPSLPMVYLPRGVDNSSGAQCVATDRRWGPLAGQLIHLSFGTGTWMPILIDKVKDQLQGAAVLVDGEFQSGAHRAAVCPADGQMYVCGMGGWGTYTPKLGCFERIRYSGEEVGYLVPVGFHVHENGVALQFNQPLNQSSSAEVLTDSKRHFAQAWNYRYSANYGSAEYSTLHPGIRAHDRLEIRSSQILDDGNTLFVELPDLQPCNQLHLSISTGPDRTCEIMATCNALDTPRSDIKGYQPVSKTIARHPMEEDLKMVDRRKPNPWKEPIKDARKLEIAAGQNLSFDQRELKVQSGETITLHFENPDVVPHNWALLKPGSLEEVGQLANRLISDPDAAYNQYMPQSDKVICYTDIVEGKESFDIYFRAPSEPGRYPYLCTFPGHWMVMNGTLIVEAANK